MSSISIPASLLMPIAALLAACGGGSKAAGGGTTVDGNDTFATAQEVATGSTTPGTISSPSDDDWYRFSTPGPGTVTVKLDALTADADLALHDPTQVLVSASNASGTATETLTRTSSVGESLRVHVVPVTAPADYDLTVSFTPAPVTDGNDTFATATAVAMGSTTPGTISSLSDDDWYRFSTPGPGTVTVTLDALTADADLALHDPTQVLVSASNNPGTATETLTWTSSVGESLRVHVIPVTAPADYDLTVSFAPATDGNDTFATATAVAMGSMTTGSIGSATDEDWYSFWTPAGTVFAKLSGLSGDADLELVDAGQVLLAASAGPGTEEEIVSHLSGAAGTFYAHVVPRGAGAAYTLTTGFVMNGAVDSNGTFDTAWDLPVGTVISELSSPSDEDWFRFTTTGAGTVTVTLDGLMADANLELYAEVSTRVVDASYLAGTAAETVTDTATTPLTYRVRIVPVASITPYRLRAVFSP